MTTPTTDVPYKGHRFPQEIISHAVWLSYRFSLSYRDVEALLAERDIVVTYASLRQWCLTFGQQGADHLRRSRPQTGAERHLDEVVLTINGRTYSLGRAVDQASNVLDLLVQRRCNTAAAKTFFRKLLQGCTYVPPVLITDILGSDEAAHKEVMPRIAHRRHRRINNGLRTYINQRAAANVPCAASRLLPMLTTSSLRLGRSAISAARDVIGSEPRTTAGNVRSDSRPGTR